MKTAASCEPLNQLSLERSRIAFKLASRTIFFNFPFALPLFYSLLLTLPLICSLPRSFPLLPTPGKTKSRHFRST